ncbi:MAG: ATP synthase F1 subunit delta [Bacteriovoracia bacterium]
MSVATIYAKALYQTQRERGGADFPKIQGSIDELVKTLEGSRELRNALFSPATSSKEKIALIDAIGKKGGYSPVLTQFLILLARKGRTALLPQIAEALDEVRLEMEGGMLGHVVSADPLDPKELEGLAKAFTGKFGKKVEFRVSTDPKLLAGLKVSVNGVTYDGSLRAQLEKLKDQFVHGNNLSN